jgi:prevent-host-death family protein
MIDISKDIRSLSDFKRNTTDFVREMKESGKPVVLTVNGRSELVVQDATSYQKLLELVDRLEAIEGIKRGLEEADRGEGVTLEEFDKEMRRKYDIPH